MSRKKVIEANVDYDTIASNNPSNDFFISHTRQHIERLHQITRSLPPEFNWRPVTAEEFKITTQKLVEFGQGEHQLVRLWWQDMLNQCQAFSLLTWWRTYHLINATTWALRRGDILACAMLSRASLETVANFAWFQSTVRPTIDDIVKSANPLVVAEFMEDELLKTLYASRQKSADKIYEPKSIVTKIEHITKKMEQPALYSHYEILCEVVHPNMLGSFLFSDENEDGSVIIKNEIGFAAKEVIPSVLFSLSWSSATLMLSVTALQESARKMLNLLDIPHGPA